MKWPEVLELHGTRKGIAVRNGVVASILCDTHKSGLYPDEIAEDRLVYVINGRTKTPGSQKLLDCIGTEARIRVFEKVRDNDWRDLGEWTPLSSEPTESGGYTRVRFKKAAP